MGAELGDPQLLRYNRQIVLPEIGIEGQCLLLQSHVLLVGLGGLGSPLAMYLAACGVGRLTLADPDLVELENLQRQILYGTSSLGRAKTEEARRIVENLNPEVRVDIATEYLRGDPLRERVRVADLVVDATDNFETRLAINQACVESGTTLVSGAVIRMEGQVAVFRNRQKEDACYQCLFGTEPIPEERCSETGVLGPVAGAVASVQAVEAVKCLLSVGEPLYNQLSLYDATKARWRTVELVADERCPICASAREVREETC